MGMHSSTKLSSSCQPEDREGESYNATLQESNFSYILKVPPPPTSPQASKQPLAHGPVGGIQESEGYQVR